MVEAGTGVGKSLAYLIPAVLWSCRTTKRLVVSTHTVNLQSQLVSKDIPLVSRMFKESGFNFEYSLFKGRSHYLCLRRWRQAYAEVAQKTALVVANEDERAVEALFDLTSNGTWDGDRDTLPNPVPDRVWSEVCSEGERCMSGKCQFRDACFYQKHRKRLEKCHLIVVNHALFAANLAIRRSTQGQGLLPSYESVIFDEAHHLEDVTRDSLGTEISPSRLKRLADDTVRLVSSGAFQKGVTKEGARRLRSALDDFTAALAVMLGRVGPRPTVPGSPKEKSRLRDPDLVGDDAPKWLRDFSGEVSTWEDFDLSDEERFEVQVLKRRYLSLAEDLDSINHLEGDGDSFVYWAEKDEAGRRSQVVLKKFPLEVGSYLQEYLWSTLPAAVLTSATLATGGNFDYLKRMLAVESTAEMILGAPFNYREQACLCVPRDSRTQDVNSPPFNEYVAGKVLEIVDMTSGRAFVLFTNRRSMERVAELVRDKVEEKGYPFLKQGDAPRDALLSEFKERGNAVLFGLDSFWEGVDVPGDALSCVVLAKLPFPVPDDPVMEAREELWKAQGLIPFAHYSLPLATLKLKQGFGRLIRSKTDRGAVVLLDPRIATKPYGRTILKSLPPARLTFDLDDIADAVPPVRSEK
jgi:ATP-dependent DNA helicase DinG